MAPVIAASVGLSALALLFLLRFAQGWAADLRARRDAVARRLRV